jgi:PAS domain S-box-containing protein
MMFKGARIQTKLMRMTLFTSGAVLCVTCASFFAYELLTYRITAVNQLSTLGQIIATNSTAALAFDSQDEGNEILVALKAERHITAACLYNADGKLFAQYPTTLSADAFPAVLHEDGFLFTEGFLEGFQPVQVDTRRLGTLYIKSDMGALDDRLMRYGIITLLVIIFATILGYLLSKRLQQGISVPILALAETAKAVSDRHDYSVRAAKESDDELGSLTDAFNHMLTQIEEQNIALRESEVRLRAVLNSALTAVVVMDHNGNVTDWNAQAERVFGWTAAEALGQPVYQLIIPSTYQDRHREGFARFLAGGQSSIIGKLMELSAMHRDGREFPVELVISVLETGGVISFCGFITDITERKNAEEKIRLFSQQLEQTVSDRTKELETSNKELESFSYSISHDLRAPLRAIDGYVNILSEEYDAVLDDEARRLMQIISRNAHRMGRLIDDLLEFSKLGRKELNKTEVNIQKLVQHTLTEISSNFDTSRLDIRLTNLPPALADYSLISQVWVNLISNAVKYSSKKEHPVVEIGSETYENEIRYFVKDNGAGFSMEYAKKLFGVFQRLHKATEFEGTGVGLAIVQRIVVKHGGRVWADGKINEGATFYFSLPGNN